MEQKTTDTEYIAQWRKLLAKIDDLQKSGKSAQEKRKGFLSLKEEATNAIHLTGRQKEGLHGRCDHAIFLIDTPDYEKSRHSGLDQLQKNRANKGGLPPSNGTPKKES